MFYHPATKIANRLMFVIDQRNATVKKYIAIDVGYVPPPNPRMAVANDLRGFLSSWLSFSM